MTDLSGTPNLESFPTRLRAAVFGASGAIGGALCESLARSPRVGRIHAFSRSGVAPTAPVIDAAPFDLTDEASIAAAAERCRREGPLHIVIVATGVLHAGAELQPEKTWRSLDATALARSYAINCIGPALVAKHFLGLLASGEKAVFAALSARVGSIEDNRLGGWHGYRASKAALHQMLRTCAIELARRAPSAYCIALHPGTVDSALSRPFQANVAPQKLFHPAYSATRLLGVIDGLAPGASGQAFAWDGSRIPF
jgi:NAD(P)-dependent dehydrogenase (short-subunit alcohol dehydrogenase family)